jgi:hypothetical protein
MFLLCLIPLLLNSAIAIVSDGRTKRLIAVR